MHLDLLSMPNRMLKIKDKGHSIVWEISFELEQILCNWIKTLNKTLKHLEAYNVIIKTQLNYQIEGWGQTSILHLV